MKITFWQGACLILAAAVILLWIMQFGCNKHIIAITPGNDSLVYWKNKANEVVASQKETPEQFTSADLERMKDSLAKLYYVKPSDVQEASVIAMVTRAELPVVTDHSAKDYEPLTAKDCPPVIRNMRDTFGNRWTSVAVQVGEDRKLTLTQHDTLIALWKTVRQGNIFNRKKYLQFDVHLADTTRAVAGIKSFRRYDIPKQTSFNLTAQTFVLDSKVYPMVGGALQRTKGRFDASLEIGKEFLNKSWYAGARLEFKLIKW